MKFISDQSLMRMIVVENCSLSFVKLQVRRQLESLKVEKETTVKRRRQSEKQFSDLVHLKPVVEEVDRTTTVGGIWNA